MNYSISSCQQIILQIKELINLSCAKIASMLQGKNSEEIHRVFNIVLDLTPEEEAKIKSENKWMEFE